MAWEMTKHRYLSSVEVLQPQWGSSSFLPFLQSCLQQILFADFHHEIQRRDGRRIPVSLKNLDSSTEQLRKLLMVPRPTKMTEKECLTQKAKPGSVTWYLNMELLTTAWFFKTCEEHSNGKSARDAVPQPVLHPSSYVIIS